MLLILSGISTLASAFKLIVLLIVFFALLYGAHLFTKWYAKSNYAGAKSVNVSVIESRQVAPGKNIVIARIGERYVSFLLLKDNAVFLTELQEEELSFHTPDVQQTGGVVSFRDVLKKVRRGNGTDHENKE